MDFSVYVDFKKPSLNIESGSTGAAITAGVLGSFCVDAGLGSLGSLGSMGCFLGLVFFFATLGLSGNAELSSTVTSLLVSIVALCCLLTELLLKFYGGKTPMLIFALWSEM